MLHKLSLRLRIFLIFAGLALGALAGLAGGLVFGYRQLGTPETLNAFVQVGMLAGLVVLLPVVLAYTAWSYSVFRGKVLAGAGYH